MTSLDEYREALGKLADGLSDEEVGKIRDTLLELAAIAYETNPERLGQKRRKGTSN